MLVLEWNALRVGDAVLVHDTPHASSALVRGRVAMVDMHRGSNGVGIRIRRAGHPQILWPSRLVVHPDPPQSAQACWRCETVINAAA